MAIPFLVAGAAVLLGAAIVGSRSDSSDNNDDNDNDQAAHAKAAKKQAAKERKKAQKQASKQLLREQFDTRLSETQETIENNVVPYFSMKFGGHCSIKEYINENNQYNFFGISTQNTEMQPLHKTEVNLNYVKTMYDVEITPDIDLHYALQEIEDSQLTLQEAQQLKQSILQTSMKLRGNNL